MKTFLGLLPLLIGIPSYLHYVRSVLRGKTVPHMYSWMIWAVLAAIGFAAQLSGHAGPGAWNTGFTALVCFAVFCISIRYGEKKLSKIDAALFVIAAAAIITRLIIGNFTVSVVLTTAAALVGFALTFKKAYSRPDQENAITFSLNSLRNLISLFALSTSTFTTFFYPACMMLANAMVAGTIYFRRRGSPYPGIESLL